MDIFKSSFSFVGDFTFEVSRSIHDDYDVHVIKKQSNLFLFLNERKNFGQSRANGNPKEKKVYFKKKKVPKIRPFY